MFGTIRRHQVWLWWFVVIIIVVSFVAFFNPNSKFGGRGGPTALGSVSGEPVTAEDFRAAQSEIMIHYFLSHGEWPDKDPSAKQLGFDVERETYYRLFLISKFKEYNIHVGNEAVGELAAEILRSFQRHNKEIDSPQVFEQVVLKPRGLTLEDFERFLHNEIALRQLVAIVTVPGHLITPAEAANLYRLEHQEITAEAVFFSPSNFLANVTITPGALSKFFTNQMARYRLPDRVQVSYVKFDVTNFFAEADQEIAKITNYNDRVDEVYHQRGTNYYSEAKTPEEAKAKIKEEDRRALALHAARNQAAQFAEDLMDRTPVQPANLAALAAEKKMTVRLTTPFDMQAGPEELTVPTTFAKSAFKLTADEPFAGPIVAEDGVYVIVLQKKIPSEIPAFDAIRAQVQTDAQFMQAEQIAKATGTNFVHTLDAGLAQRKTFNAICAEAKITPTSLPPFSLSTRSLPEIENHVSLGLLQQAAFGLPVRATSGFVPNGDGGGLILHIVSRTPVSEEQVTKESPAFLAQVRQTRAGEAFNAWFGREAQTALRDTPLTRQRSAAQ